MMQHPSVVSPAVAALDLDQRMAMVKVLQSAALQLWDGVGQSRYDAASPRQSYVCHAIQVAEGPGDIKNLLKAWITHQIGETRSLVSWMAAEGQFEYWNYSCGPDLVREAQAVRHAWIAAMINYLEVCNETPNS